MILSTFSFWYSPRAAGALGKARGFHLDPCPGQASSTPHPPSPLPRSRGQAPPARGRDDFFCRAGPPSAPPISLAVSLPARLARGPPLPSLSSSGRNFYRALPSSALLGRRGVLARTCLLPPSNSSRVTKFAHTAGGRTTGDQCLQQTAVDFVPRQQVPLGFYLLLTHRWLSTSTRIFMFWDDGGKIFGRRKGLFSAIKNGSRVRIFQRLVW